MYKSANKYRGVTALDSHVTKRLVVVAECMLAKLELSISLHAAEASSNVRSSSFSL